MTGGAMGGVTGGATGGVRTWGNGCATEGANACGTTPDGPAYDQSDWADARLIAADGHPIYLDEDRGNLLIAGDDPPLAVPEEQVEAMRV